MHKLVAVAVVLIAGGSFAVAQAAVEGPAAKTAVCHRTSSKTRPYVRIVVGAGALRKYTSVADDIVPAPRTCPQTLLTPAGGGVAIEASMVGVAEQPDLGDPDGSGTAAIRLRRGEGKVCFRLEVKDIGQAAAAHIHKGPADGSGPVAVTLTAPGAGGSSAGCVAAPRVVVNDILANRSAYYVNVHTADFQNGAVRAQLQRPTSVSILTGAPMSGANEKPNPGDADGTGASAFQINLDANRLCYTLQAANIPLPATAAHIHRGDASISGPVVIPFTQPGASGTSGGCVAVDGALLREIITNPAGFYSNIHSTEFPGGAVRAPLAVQS